MPAGELYNELSYFYKPGVFGEFKSVNVGGYTWDVPGFNSASGTFPLAYSGYKTAYIRAKEELRSDDIYFVRLIGVGLWMVQYFEFENEKSENVVLRSDRDGAITIGDIREIKENNKEWVAEIYEALESNRNLTERYKTTWLQFDAGIDDAKVTEKYPRVGGDNNEVTPASE